jgi:hypothetical protein
MLLMVIRVLGLWLMELLLMVLVSGIVQRQQRGQQRSLVLLLLLLGEVPELRQRRQCRHICMGERILHTRR